MLNWRESKTTPCPMLVLIVDGNSEHVTQALRKIISNLLLGQITNFTVHLLCCTPISELLSDKSTMNLKLQWADYCLYNKVVENRKTFLIILKVFIYCAVEIWNFAVGGFQVPRWENCIMGLKTFSRPSW